MTNYKQLGQEQRYVIDRLLSNVTTLTAIAVAVGCSKSTISREIRRNGYVRPKEGKVYNPLSAQNKAEKRHFSKPESKRQSGYSACRVAV